MDQGTVVAIVALAGSFLTVLVTGAVSIWSKWIESEQKVKEHQLSIRSVYVNKKIEAGQKLVGATLVKIRDLEARYQFFTFIRDEKSISSDISAISKKVSDAVIDKMTSFEEYDLLYFDVVDIHNEIADLTLQANTILRKINPVLHHIMDGKSMFTPEFKNNINDYLNIFLQVIKKYEDLISYVRKDLAKYDIV